MSIKEYECPLCGGKLEFDAGTQQLTCPYCLASFDPEEYDREQAEKEQPKSAGPEDIEDAHFDEGGLSGWREGETEGMMVYTCASCGGEIIADQTLASTHCPYCDNPVVVPSQFAGDLKPNWVIPFQVDYENAKQVYYKHAKRQKLVPKIFKDKKQLDEIKGVYVPYWVINCDADAEVLYRAEKVSERRTSQQIVRTTEIYNVTREGRLTFQNIPVEASTKHEEALLESIEPFNFDQAVPFSTAYLSGFLADRYDIEPEAVNPRVEERIKSSVRRTFADTMNGYSTYSIEDMKLGIVNGSTGYAMLPIWFMNVKWKDKLYRFAVNGQTGKVAGELPEDKGILWRYRLIYGFIFLLICVAAGYFLGPLVMRFFS